MAIIKILKDNELIDGTDDTDVYPVSSTQAIYSQNSDGTVPTGLKGSSMPKLETRLAEMADVILALVPFEDAETPAVALSGASYNVEYGTVLSPTFIVTFTKNGCSSVSEALLDIDDTSYTLSSYTEDDDSIVYTYVPDSFTVGSTITVSASISYDSYDVTVSDSKDIGIEKTVTVDAGTATASSQITPFRDCFFNADIEVDDEDDDGVINEADVLKVIDALDSDTIRSWTDTLGAATGTHTVTLEEGAQLMAFAVPSGSTVTVSSVDSFETDWTENMQQRTTTVSVYGANGYTAVDYDVYYYSNYSGFKTETSLSIEIQ